MSNKNTSSDNKFTTSKKESDFIAQYIEKQFNVLSPKPLDKKEKQLLTILKLEPKKKQYFA